MENNTVPLPPSTVWKVPRSKANLMNQQLREEILQAIQPVLFGDYWDYPKLLLKFEEKFSQFIKLKYVAGVQSGTAAILLALKAAGIKPGDEIITVANSDMSTTSPIAICGGVPVFCDILASDYTMDPEKVEALITERTTGLLPVDLYGHPANMKVLQQIAKRHNLFIVEDAALATAAQDYNLPMGAFSDLVCFSTTSTKQIGAFGNGGMVATDKADLRHQLELYRSYGLDPKAQQNPHTGSDQIVNGFNLQMSPADAVVVTIKLDLLPAWTEKRKQIARHYEARLSGITGINLPIFRPESDPVQREYALCIDQQNHVFNFLREKGIQAAINYSPPAHQRPVYKSLNLPGSTSLSITEEISTKILTLPMDPLLSENDIDYVCDQLILAAN